MVIERRPAWSRFSEYLVVAKMESPTFQSGAGLLDEIYLS